jgi:O-methyltransferase involved in polyketide biosynthesis
MAGEKVHLTKEKETLLITVMARRWKAGSPLATQDRFAAGPCAASTLDFSRPSRRQPRSRTCHPARDAGRLDIGLSGEEPERHRSASRLADTRIFRIDPPAGVGWFDVDYHKSSN